MHCIVRSSECDMDPVITEHGILEKDIMLQKHFVGAMEGSLLFCMVLDGCQRKVVSLYVRTRPLPPFLVMIPQRTWLMSCMNHTPITNQSTCRGVSIRTMLEPFGI